MNHLIATSKSPVSSETLEAALIEINDRRFKGLFIIDALSDIQWNIHHPNADLYQYSFGLWLETKRMIEMRPSVGQFSWWMTTVFQDELATRFKGRCGDEFGARWDANTKKYRTYEDWVIGTARPGRGSRVMKLAWKTIFEKELKTMPKDIQAIAK